METEECKEGSGEWRVEYEERREACFVECLLAVRESKASFDFVFVFGLCEERKRKMVKNAKLK